MSFTGFGLESMIGKVGTSRSSILVFSQREKRLVITHLL